MITVKGIEAATDYVGTTHELTGPNINTGYAIGSVILQAVATGINSAIKIKVQQSLDGSNFDDVRNDNFESYELSLNSTQIRVVGFEKIHARYFRIVTDSGSASAGTFDLIYQFAIK